MKVLFVVKKRINYGASYGLINSARFVSNFLNHAGIESKVTEAKDANAIDKIVTEYNPSHVIIEALWVTPEKFEELLKKPRHKNREWIVRLHSRLPFLATEGIAIEWLKKYKDITIAPNVSELANDLKQTLNLDTAYLPNIYYPYEYKKIPKQEKDSDFIDIGCFGAVRPMKNHLSQAVAAVRFANSEELICRFHINATRLEQGGESVIKNLRNFFGDQEHQLVEHDWLTHEDFDTLVQQMDIGLQVSLTETFNVIAADFIVNSIPIVGSKEIPFLPWLFIADPNSTDSITDQLRFAWSFPGYNLQWMSVWSLDSYNKEAEKQWLHFLD